jgi:predicted transposase YdaD
MFNMLEIELEKLPSYLIGEKHGVQKGEKIGEQKGRLDSAIAIAKQLLNFNLSLEDISKVTGIALPDLERFKKEKKD